VRTHQFQMYYVVLKKDIRGWPFRCFVILDVQVTIFSYNQITAEKKYAFINSVHPTEPNDKSVGNIKTLITK
jgi:hypothetical protein